MAKTPLEDFFDLKVKIMLFQKDSYILLSDFIDPKFNIEINSVGENYVIYIRKRRDTVNTYIVDSKTTQTSCRDLLEKMSAFLKSIFINKNISYLNETFLNPQSQYYYFFEFENPEKMQAIASQLQQKTA